MTDRTFGILSSLVVILALGSLFYTDPWKKGEPGIYGSYAVFAQGIK